jgi:hypothetical protein
MLDDRFDDQLREAAHDYNAPPETPRDQMWEKIVAARKEGTRVGGKDRADDILHDPRIGPFRRSLVPSAGPWVSPRSWHWESDLAE